MLDRLTDDHTLAAWRTEPRHVTSCPEEVAVKLALAANRLRNEIGQAIARGSTTPIDDVVATFNRDDDPRVSRLISRLVRWH